MRALVSDWWAYAKPSSPPAVALCFGLGLFDLCLPILVVAQVLRV
jgi:hypothetical protein